jgi:small subunit ribosomal protein S3
MGQKCNPRGLRVGFDFNRLGNKSNDLGWSSRWFATKKNYGAYANEDILIRNFLYNNYSHTRIDSIDIERSGTVLKVVIRSALPGYLIGKKGQDIEKLKKRLSAFLNRDSIDIVVQEVHNICFSARVVAQAICEQLERRVSFKKVIKKAGADVMQAGAEGVKICVGGRLDGAEIARREWVRLGKVPLHTLRADIDYDLVEAKTIYGIIGIKVWISRGDASKEYK